MKHFSLNYRQLTGQMKELIDLTQVVSRRKAEKCIPVEL